MAAPSTFSAPMASIGVPSEIKRDERRVALTPDGVSELVAQGMEVRV
ncbi:MAG: alanine dehydrogenase, partial [Cyanobium sp.]